MLDVDNVEQVLIGAPSRLPDFNLDVLQDRLSAGWRFAEDRVKYTLANGPVDHGRGFLFRLGQGEYAETFEVADGPRTRAFVKEERLRLALDDDFYSMYDTLLESHGWDSIISAVHRDSLRSLFDSIVELTSKEFGACLTYLKIHLPGPGLLADGSTYLAPGFEDRVDQGLFKRLQFDPQEWLPELTEHPIYIVSAKHDPTMKRLSAAAIEKAKPYMKALKRLGVGSESYHPLRASFRKDEEFVGLLNLHFPCEIPAHELANVQRFIEENLPNCGDVLLMSLQRTMNMLLLKIAFNGGVEEAVSLRRLFAQSLSFERPAPEYDLVKVGELLDDLLSDPDSGIQGAPRFQKREIGCLEWFGNKPAMRNALRQLILFAQSSFSGEGITLGGWKEKRKRYFNDTMYLVPGECKRQDLESVEEKCFFDSWTVNGNSDGPHLRRVVADATAFCHGGYTGSLRTRDKHHQTDGALISVPKRALTVAAQ